jgi:hypothetical protein
MKRFASERNVLLTRPSIGQALADDALGQFFGARAIVHAKSGAVVVAEIELGKVAMQMLRARDGIPPAGTPYATLPRVLSEIGHSGFQIRPLRYGPVCK